MLLLTGFAAEVARQGFMTPGALLLRFRQTFGHGLRTAYYRDVVRPHILQTPPVEDTRDKTCEIHILTSAQDWLNLVWTLKSFYAVSARRYAVCIHDDGTLDHSACEALQRHFPAARIIRRQQADTKLASVLKDFPRCQSFRQSNHLSPKLFDFPHYSKSERILLLDSDVLFFREPTELLRRIEDPTYQKNCVNGDVASAYTVDPLVVSEHKGMCLIARFNSGLGLIHKNSLCLRSLEEFLSLPGTVDGHFWRIEQTLYALCSSRFGVELLPEEYSVRLDWGINGSPCRHYVGAIRQLFYREGIRHLIQSGLLKSNGSA